MEKSTTQKLLEAIEQRKAVISAIESGNLLAGLMYAAKRVVEKSSIKSN